MTKVEEKLVERNEMGVRICARWTEEENIKLLNELLKTKPSKMPWMGIYAKITTKTKK